jgi:hypothetical protein
MTYYKRRLSTAVSSLDVLNRRIRGTHVVVRRCFSINKMEPIVTLRQVSVLSVVTSFCLSLCLSVPTLKRPGSTRIGRVLCTIFPLLVSQSRSGSTNVSLPMMSSSYCQYDKTPTNYHIVFASTRSTPLVSLELDYTMTGFLVFYKKRSHGLHCPKSQVVRKCAALLFTRVGQQLKG